MIRLDSQQNIPIPCPHLHQHLLKERVETTRSVICTAPFVRKAIPPFRRNSRAESDDSQIKSECNISTRANTLKDLTRSRRTETGVILLRRVCEGWISAPAPRSPSGCMAICGCSSRSGAAVWRCEMGLCSIRSTMFFFEVVTLLGCFDETFSRVHRCKRANMKKWSLQRQPVSSVFAQHHCSLNNWAAGNLHWINVCWQNCYSYRQATDWLIYCLQLSRQHAAWTATNVIPLWFVSFKIW